MKAKTSTLFKTAILLFILSAQNAFAQIPSNGLVAYYPFSGNANDQSGNGVNGTPTAGGFPATISPVLTADRYAVANSAYDFQPAVYSTPYIDLGMASQFSFDSTSSFSISLWMKYTFYQVSATMFANDQWHLGIRNLGGNDHLNLVVGTTSFNSDSLLHPGAWVHVAGVYNRANKTMELYINGALATGFEYNGTIYGPQGQASMNTANCTLCLLNSMPSSATQIALLSNSTTAFKGSLDDILFYNRALSGTEVGNIFTATGGPSGIEERSEKSNFIVSPNPGNGFIDVQISSGVTHAIGLKVFAADGRLVMEQKNAQMNQQLDLSKFGSGNYLIKLETEDGFYSRKVSVVN